MVVLAEDYDAAQSELTALREELADWKHLVGAVCATIPLAETLKATEAQPSMVQYFKGLHAERDNLQKYLTAAEQRNAELEALLDTPHTSDWFEGVKFEAGHQIKRWGSEHDAGKGPADWFWLIGYLAQKAMGAQMLGDTEKAKHHTVSTGAALLNWFRAITGDSNAMRPGIDDSALKPNESGASE